jgi:hypothetical protein
LRWSSAVSHLRQRQNQTQVSQSVSGSATRIMDMVIRIPITDITGHIRITDMLARRFTGLTATAFIIGIIAITGIGAKPESAHFSRPAGANARRFYFFGDAEFAGANVDVDVGDDDS